MLCSVVAPCLARMEKNHGVTVGRRWCWYLGFDGVERCYDGILGKKKKVIFGESFVGSYGTGSDDGICCSSSAWFSGCWIEIGMMEWTSSEGFWKGKC